jgi:hypothetical protein
MRGGYLIGAAVAVAIAVIAGSFVFGLSAREHTSLEGPVQLAAEQDSPLGRYLSGLKDIGYYVDLSGHRFVEGENALELFSLYYDETAILLEYGAQGMDPLSEGPVLEASGGVELRSFATAVEVESSKGTILSFYPPVSGDVEIWLNSPTAVKVAGDVEIAFRADATPTRLVPVGQFAQGSGGLGVELQEVQIGITSRLHFRLGDKVQVPGGAGSLWLLGELDVSGERQAWQARADLDSAGNLVTSAGRIELSQPVSIVLYGIGRGYGPDVTYPLDVRWDFLSFPD